MAVQRTHWWQLAVVLAILVALVALGECFPVSGGRLRRVHKSTYSESTGTDVQKTAGGRPFTARKLVTTTKTTVATATTTTLRQRVDQAVQKVRARSKELQMEQEQKRVYRKLRRDEKRQQERDLAPPAEPINPHHLNMPHCPAGKVYNGRRCVVMGKSPKH
uniref:Uncharacterized protein n=1 Tax=Anopheles dirus TaxID=7168 RepID=A0A182MZY6_9DIPT